MEAARDLALLWERVGSPVRPEAYTPIAEPAATTEPERPTVQVVVSVFMADGKDRGNSPATLSKKAVVFKIKMPGLPASWRSSEDHQSPGKRPVVGRPSHGLRCAGTTFKGLRP